MYILQPCVTLSTLLSSERYSCAVNLGLFLFFSMFFFPFCWVRWVVLSFFLSLLPPSSFL